MIDIELREGDGLHPSDAGYQVLSDRMVGRILSLFGKSSTNFIGPRVTSASYSGSTVTLQVTHDNGVSLSGSEVDFFHVTDDDVAATISSITIDNDADTITLNLSAAIVAGSDVKVWVHWESGVNYTFADLVKDNTGLPLRAVVEMDVVEV